MMTSRASQEFVLKISDKLIFPTLLEATECLLNVTECFQVLLFKSHFLISFIHDHVLVLQELFAIQPSSGDTDSSVEPLRTVGLLWTFTMLQKENRGIRQKELKQRRNETN